MELVVGTRKGLFVWVRGADGWRIDRTAFLGVPVSAVCTGERWWVALDHGHFGAKLHRSDDGGRTWEELAAPAFPVQEDGPSVGMIWAIERGGDGVLWAGTVPAALFRSEDGGGSWSLCEGLWNTPARSAWFGGGMDHPGLHTVLIDPREPRRVTVGISVGGVWRSEDAGATWDVIGTGMRAAFVPPDRAADPNIQDVHRMAVCGADPDVVWCQHHNNAYRSTDGARTWTELAVPPSVFGFAVMAHPDDPGTAWFVPAKVDGERIPVAGQVVVSRTRDGGQTFEEMRDGLPQEHAYDLVYRHAADVDGAGEVLAIGSTTGNLWVSEDGGEGWQVLSHHLPPVYVVRFV